MITGDGDFTVINADNTVTYTPNANYTGADSFTFRANDGIADSPSFDLLITVTPVNDAPWASCWPSSRRRSTAPPSPPRGLSLTHSRYSARKIGVSSRRRASSWSTP